MGLFCAERQICCRDPVLFFHEKAKTRHRLGRLLSSSKLLQSNVLSLVWQLFQKNTSITGPEADSRWQD